MQDKNDARDNEETYNKAKRRRRGNIKEEKREQNESLCLSGWAEGPQSLAGVLLLTAAVASVLYLKVVP